MRLHLLLGCALLAACGENLADVEDVADVPEGTVPDAPPGTQAGQVAPKPSSEEAMRFLAQASFGPAPGDGAVVEDLGFARWIEAQAQTEAVAFLPRLESMGNARREAVTDLFWESAIEGEDQLRARVTYALANIVTVSLRAGRFADNPETFAHYYDILNANAFGNYQDLIRDVSMSPAMGEYLSHLGNRRADPDAGIAPDENYAREVMQLFTIGLEELNADGTPKGEETYTTEDVQGLAAVFTGLSWADTDFERPRVRDFSNAVPMESYRSFHEVEAKSFLGTTVDVGGDAVVSVEAGLDHLLAHDNLAPFVTRQLIQHLVTSNPTPAYVGRVSAAFEVGTFSSDGVTFGDGRRGDMMATVAAILLDNEARSAAAAQAPGFGRLRDPILRFTHLTRAFRDDGGARRIGEPESSGAMRYADRPDILGQSALAPPSVFGWYRPGYVSPGGWAAQNDAVVPELQIATGSTMSGYVDWMARTIRGDIWGDTDFFDLDFAGVDTLTEQPAALVDALDMALTSGAMTEATKARIVQTVELIDVDDRNTDQDRTNRLRLAVLMTVTAPEYAVQR